MPKIPEYNRNVGVQKTGMPRQGISREHRAITRMGESLNQAAQAIQKAKAFKETNEANAYAFEKLNEQRLKAQSDMEMDYDQYQKDIDKIGAEAVNTISSPEAREAFQTKFARQAETVKYGIRNNFRQKEIRAAQASLEYQGESLVTSFPTMTDLEKTTALADFKSSVKDSIGIGLYTEDEAKILLEETQKEVNKAEASFDAQYNPDMFLENIDDYDIDDETMKELQGTATNKQKLVKKEEIRIRKETQQQNAITITQQIVSPDGELPSVNDINRMMGNDRLSQDFAKAYKKATTSSKITNDKIEADESGFTGYAKDVFDSEDPDQIQAAIVNTLNGGGDGKVNQQEMAILLQLAMARNEEINKGESWIGKIGKALFGDGDDKEKKELVEDYAKEVVNGAPPEKAKSMAKDKDNIRKNPNRAKYSIGDVVETPSGTMYVWGYYEDGEPEVRFERPKK